MAAAKVEPQDIKIENGVDENNGQNQEGPQFSTDRGGRGRGNFRGQPRRMFRGGPRGGGGGFRGDFHGRRGPPMGGFGGGPNVDAEDRRDDRFHGPPGPARFDKVPEKRSIFLGPTYDLPPINSVERKFSGRTRLYIGNIIQETDEQGLKDLFAPYGETSEYFINKEKNFAFVRFDYRANAEKAKHELDGTLIKGKNVRIRFAPNGSTVKVKNLTPFVSNELLYQGFTVFGEVERAYVIVDDRGKSSGEGVVEFTRKGFALNAIRKCADGCFFLTSSLRPCIVEAFEPSDDLDGLQDKYLPRKHPDFVREREIGPRFGSPQSFEATYGNRWKELYEQFAQKEASLKREFDLEKEKLEAQMQFARYEHETEMLRKQLRSREMDRERQKHEWEMKEKLAEEQIQRSEEHMRRQQEEMQGRISKQEEEMRRRQQENNLFMQAHQLDHMLEQQEQQGFEPPPPNNFNSNLEDGGNHSIMVARSRNRTKTRWEDNH